MGVITTTAFLGLPTGETVFYRTAGPENGNTVLLLHGFPSSSHQYRNLIPLLGEKHRVIAPDLPGYGFTTVPEGYRYTFAALTETVKSFLKALPNPPKTYTIYIFDYGAPTGLRLALSNPSAVKGIISQSGNAYVEGLTPFWDPIKKYWGSGDLEDRNAIRNLLKAETTKYQYTEGAPADRVGNIAPETYTLDQWGMDRPGNDAIQLDLFYDYRTNLDWYPKFQEWFRASQVPVLAAWGKNDFIFGPKGAEAFKKDLPKAEVHLLDAGHFALETNLKELSDLIIDFLDRHNI